MAKCLLCKKFFRPSSHKPVPNLNIEVCPPENCIILPTTMAIFSVFFGLGFFSIEKSSSGYDIIIATSWQSVYYVRNFSGYKAYFVQDFEPYFFKLNERYLLAKKTYELGLHIISLGK